MVILQPEAQGEPDLRVSPPRWVCGSCGQAIKARGVWGWRSASDPDLVAPVSVWHKACQPIDGKWVFRPLEQLAPMIQRWLHRRQPAQLRKLMVCRVAQLLGLTPEAAYEQVFGQELPPKPRPKLVPPPAPEQSVVVPTPFPEPAVKRQPPTSPEPPKAAKAEAWKSQTWPCCAVIKPSPYPGDPDYPDTRCSEESLPGRVYCAHHEMEVFHHPIYDKVRRLLNGR